MPGITAENVGTCRPSDLLGALALFRAKYEGDG